MTFALKTEGIEKKGGYIMSDEFFNQDGTGNVTDQTSDTGMYSAPESQTYSAPEPDVQSETQSVQQETFNQGAAQEESVNQNYGSWTERIQ